MEGTVAKAVLNYMMEEPGGLSVMITGDTAMQKLSADSLDVAGPSVPLEMHILGQAQALFSWMM